MSGPKGDPFVAVSADVARHERRLNDHDGRLDQLGSDITRVARITAELQVAGSAEAGEGEKDEARIEWWWPSMSADEAAVCWAELCAWVKVVQDRYPNLTQALKKCWYRHPAALDWMSALYLAWKGAYSSGSASYAREEWLERWLRAAVGAVGELLNDCRGSCYLLDSGTGVADLSLEEHIEADIAERRRLEAVGG